MSKVNRGCFSVGAGDAYNFKIRIEREKFIKENWFKVGILSAVLIFSFSVYNYLVVRPKEEVLAKIEIAKIEDANAKTKQESIDGCVRFAQLNYSLNWANTCKTNAKRVEDGFKNCINSVLSVSDCRGLWGYGDDSSDCSLPTKNADYINQTLKDEKSDCYNKYR